MEEAEPSRCAATGRSDAGGRLDGPVSSLSTASVPPSGAPGQSRLPGPFPVGAYAAQLRRRLREFTHVQLTGEVWGLRVTRARVYFELRDAAGALPCSIWREDYDTLGCTLADGTLVVAGGGCDYYPGSATSSPSFSLRSPGAPRRRARATCSPSSSDCAADSTPRGCSPRRRRSRGRRSRAASAWSARRRARRATTCSPACIAAAGPGAWCGPTRPSRTAEPPPRSPRDCANLRPLPRSRS